MRYDTGVIRSLQRLWVAGAPLVLVLAGALSLVVAGVVASPGPKPGYREPRAQAAFHRVGVGDSTAKVRSLMGNPDYVSSGRQVLEHLVGRPKRFGRISLVQVRQMKIIRAVAVQTWYFGGLYDKGSYELDFANGRLAAKYRY